MSNDDKETGHQVNVEETKWIHFVRQLHVCSTAWVLYFMNGLSAGATTVFIPQIRKDSNSTMTIDDELASWIYAASNGSALPWLLFLPTISKFIGRKIPSLVCSIAITIVFTFLYFSSTPYHILIAEVIQGFVNAVAVTTIILVIPEYCDHRYRSMYINIMCTSYYWGMWVSNAIGTYFNWKFIAVLGFICSLYSLTIGFCPKSPRWLASKGRITESEAAYRWLHGTNTESEKELRDLIKSHAEYSGKPNKITFSELLKTIKCKQFYMPILLVTLIAAQYNFSGKMVCSIYAIDMFKKITKSEEAAYTGMLILDGVTVLGMYVGSFLSKILKLRSLYFNLSFLSISAMFIFSLYLYLIRLGVVEENDYIALGFLVVYSLAISSGPVVLTTNFYSILISIRYQAVSHVIVSFIFFLSCAGMLKFAPVIFKEIDLHGSFLFYAVSCSITTTLLYIYLPETKDKTLEEIEEVFKDIKHFPEAELLTKSVEKEVEIEI